MILRTGIDLIEVERFRSQKPEIRERFISRVYTDDERAYCGENDQHLAGRFAAKEAVDTLSAEFSLAFRDTE